MADVDKSTSVGSLVRKEDFFPSPRSTALFALALKWLLSLIRQETKPGRVVMMGEGRRMVGRNEGKIDGEIRTERKTKRKEGREERSSRVS